MKKILSFLATAAVAFAFTACDDVPAPYSINDSGEGTNTGFSYVSNNLLAGWSLKAVDGKEQPWSQGNSYTQATGYQKWDGADQKSNKEVEGWLISPAFNTAGTENVKLSFDYTIKYTNNVADWKNFHKVYVSKDYNGADVNAATWTELNVNLVESPYSDWTLYTSGQIQIPEEFVGAENLRVAFWFYAPAASSTTWELQNFRIEEGIATNEPTETGKNYKFVRADKVEDGKQYLIVADGKMATPITGSSTYGYLGVSPVGIKDKDFIVVNGLTNAFTFKLDATADIAGYVGSAYNIIQSDGRYLWAQEGTTYKNFNVAENPEGDKAWIVSTQQDGTFRIVCGNIGRFVQYSKTYPSFGCYVDEQSNAVYPELFELIGETDEEVTKPEGTEPGTEPGTDPTPATGDNLLANGDFESWTGGLPDNWKTTTSAGNATLSQSTDAHGGQYSVKVATASTNKRLGYKEITLKAGTYTMQFYAKGGGQVRPGYVPVTDGKVGSYAYGNYTNTTEDGWTLVSHEFTLAAETTVNLVVMNPSNQAKDVLIDDFTLTTSNGGIADGGTTEPTQPTQTAQFRQVTSVTAGKQYLIVAENGGALTAAQPVPSGKDYNYLAAVSVTATGGVITADPANAFTFVAYEGGYKIQQPDGRLLWMDATHTSFQCAAAPTEGLVWTVEPDASGAGFVTIRNVALGKYVQFSTKHNSWGSYSDAQENALMPKLYEKVN
ncbi:MAG: hypothetical protein IJ659_01835 [Alloprevotella sp.]|nr:hypothetical protein [Alloprevotella sp.]